MRQSWNNYFLSIAEIVATRATCDRLHCGCVLVKDNRILSTGYNGSLPGMDHCDEVGHLLKNGHCIATEHAERNAVANAAKVGICTNGAIAYVTHAPCWDCFKHLTSAGIKCIIYNTDYGTDKYPESMEQILKQTGVVMISNAELDEACSSIYELLKDETFVEKICTFHGTVLVHVTADVTASDLEKIPKTSKHKVGVAIATHSK